MLKITFLTLSIFFIFGISQTNARVNSFDMSQLSEKGQKAYKNLIKAERFESGHVGRGGGLSAYIKDFGIILKEKNADSAFNSIIENGTLSAKLYGLSGIYFTNHEHFKSEVEDFAKNEQMVQTINGCIVGETKVSEIVLSKKENVAIIKPTQTFEDFAKDNNTNYVLDISNGGYPAIIKSFVERK